MPHAATQQFDGFQMDNLEYQKMPAMRFIGIEDKNFHSETDEEYAIKKKKGLQTMTETLGAMAEFASGFDYDVLFQHHYGKGVDVEEWHGFWGRFMRADAPVPEGFAHFDFVPERDVNNFVEGPPFFPNLPLPLFPAI